MIDIAFPDHQFKIKKEKGKDIIFDEIRKQWYILTPEEWVRQNFLQYLIQGKKYPATLIAIEKEMYLGELKKRCDIIIYKKDKPWMIVECKEMDVKLTEAVLQQILNYNISLNVDYLIITNGKATFGLELKDKNFTWLNELPDYK